MEPRIGVGIVIRRGDEILLQLRNGLHGGGTWSTPGGHLDLGEDPAACACREALEETGIAVGPPRFVGATNDVFDERVHYVTLWYEAEGAAGEPAVAAPDELVEVGWYPTDRLPEPLFPPLRRFLAGELL